MRASRGASVRSRLKIDIEEEKRKRISTSHGVGAFIFITSKVTFFFLSFVKYLLW